MADSGFEWKAPAAQFEIFGVPCEVEIGDAEVTDRLVAAGKKLERFDLGKKDAKGALAMSHELRNVIRCAIGDEAAGKVFDGRKPNIAMETSMVAYIFERINEANAEAQESIAQSVSRIAALGKPIGDEE